MGEKIVTNLELDERKRFTFLRAWQEVFDALDDYEQKGKFAEAIIHYCFFGEEPNFDDTNDYALRLVWIQTKEAANFGLTKYCSGKMGGAPIGNNNAQKTTKNNQKTTKNNQKTTKNNTTLHYTTQKKENKPQLIKEKGGGGDVFSDENNKPTEAEFTEFITAKKLEYIQPDKLYQELNERNWRMIGNDSEIKAWKQYVRSVNDGRKNDNESIADWAKKPLKAITKIYE